jgi:hypothetical protein
MILRGLVESILTISLLASCAKFEAQSSSSDSEDKKAKLTGGKGSTGKPSTTASDDGELPTLKTELPGDRNGNAAFASSILQIGVERQVKDSTFKVTVSLKSQSAKSIQVVFSSPLGFNQPIEDLSPENASQRYRLSLVCRDEACATIVGHFRTSNLSGSAGDVSKESQAGFVYRVRSSRIQWVGPFASSTSRNESSVKKIVQSMIGVSEVPMITTEIAWGVSRFSLDLSKSDLCLSGELVETGSAEEDLAIGCAAFASSPNLAASLIGNDDRGDLLIRFSDTVNWALLKVYSNKDKSVPKTPITPVVPDDPKKTFIPYDYTNPITRSWESDRNNIEIMQHIDKWAKGKGYMEKMRGFLTRVRPNMPILMDAMQSQSVPAEMIFISMIESHFFDHPGYPIEISGPLAVGPWQFMADTARRSPFNLEVKPLISYKVADKVHRRVDPCDDRADLELSSKAAAKFFKILFTTFKTDPRFALVAYNWGPTRTLRAMDCAKTEDCMKARLAKKNEMSRLRELTDAGVDFWTIRSFKMAPDESIDYVMDFVAAQFIGRDPAKYGFDLPSEKAANVPPAPVLCHK